MPKIILPLVGKAAQAANRAKKIVQHAAMYSSQMVNQPTASAQAAAYQQVMMNQPMNFPGSMYHNQLLNSQFSMNLSKAERRMLEQILAEEHRLPVRKSKEALVGYRGWRLSNGMLCSTAAPFIWRGPVLRDMYPPDANENPNRHHGIHAYHRFKNAVNHCRDIRESVAYGTVLLFGTVVVHEMGYRAQCAMIRSLYIPLESGATKNLLLDLAKRYECDVYTDWTLWLKTEMELEGQHGNGR